MTLYQVVNAYTVGATSKLYGTDWLSDASYVTGTTNTFGLTTPLGRSGDTAGFYPTSSTERYGSNWGYNFPLANGDYIVELILAEGFYNSAGNRVFDVTIEGVLVLDNYDPYASVGHRVLDSKRFPVTVTGGNLDIDFVASVDNANCVSVIIWQEVTELKLQALNDLDTPETGWTSLGYYMDAAPSASETGNTIDLTDPSVPVGTTEYIFQVEHYGNLGYTIKASNGDYDVELYFSENFHTSTGSRRFDIEIEGNLVNDDYDIYDNVGARYKGIVVTHPSVTVSDGYLNLELLTVTDNAKIDAIVIRESETGSDVLVEPTGLTAYGSRVNPTVTLGSISVTPNGLTAYGSKIDPAITLGSISVSPNNLNAYTSKTDPTLSFSSTTSNPSNLDAYTKTDNPSVTLGALSLNPASLDAYAATTNPSVLFGSTVSEPSNLEAEILTNSPTVILGNLSLSPSVLETFLSTNQPTVILGSVSVTPSSIDSYALTNEPNVSDALTFNPDEVTAFALTNNPTVILSSITVNPNGVEAFSSRINPTIELGSLVLNPSGLEAFTLTNSPTVQAGESITVNPSAIVAYAARTNPLIELGSIVISPVNLNAYAKADGSFIVASRYGQNRLRLLKSQNVLNLLVAGSSLSTLKKGQNQLELF